VRGRHRNFFQTIFKKSLRNPNSFRSRSQMENDMLCRSHIGLGNGKHDESLSAIARGREFNILSSQYYLPPEMCTRRKYHIGTHRGYLPLYIYTYITPLYIIEKAAATILYITLLYSNINTLRSMRYNNNNNNNII